jgi:hypothetical protein
MNTGKAKYFYIRILALAENEDLEFIGILRPTPVGRWPFILPIPGEAAKSLTTRARVSVFFI